MISIALDGPAGVGKSTISKLLAKKLGWNCLDTGALYRALTVACLKRKIDFQDQPAIIETIKDAKLDVKYLNGVQHTFLNGEDVSVAIREKNIDKNVAYVSQILKVRQKVLEFQRSTAKSENIVVEGRDIGDVVLPESKNKFFLTASVEERAKRRFLERKNRGENADFNEIKNDIAMRDKIDSERKISPLKQAKDAKLVDTTKMNIEEVVDFIYSKLVLDNSLSNKDILNK